MVRNNSGISENLLEPDGKVLENTLSSTPHPHAQYSRVVWGHHLSCQKFTNAPYVSLDICRNIAQV